MEHPKVADGGWTLRDLVLDGGAGEVAVAVVESGQELRLAIRWCEGDQRVTPWPGHGTDWFLLPLTFGAAIGRSLIEMKAGGLGGFNEAGFAAMVTWLAESEMIHDCLCF